MRAGRISLLTEPGRGPGFMHGDRGEITLDGAADDISAGRWERLKVTPESS